jgi:hypothetical protein
MDWMLPNRIVPPPIWASAWVLWPLAFAPLLARAVSSRGLAAFVLVYELGAGRKPLTGLWPLKSLARPGAVSARGVMYVIVYAIGSFALALLIVVLLMQRNPPPPQNLVGGF